MGANRDGREAAHFSLARAHIHGRVALQCLNVVEAFGNGLMQIFLGHILAQADEALAVADVKLGENAGPGEDSIVSSTLAPATAALLQVGDAMPECRGCLGTAQLGFLNLLHAIERARGGTRCP